MSGKTHKTTWKARERQGAKMFGANRQRCSGSSGLAHETRSDSTHPRLYLECKLRPSSAVRTLFDQTQKEAKREGKTPVLLLATKNKPGFLVVVDSADLAAMVAEYAAALPDGGKEALEGAIRSAYLRQRGEEPEGDAAAPGGVG